MGMNLIHSGHFEEMQEMQVSSTEHYTKAEAAHLGHDILNVHLS